MSRVKDGTPRGGERTNNSRREERGKEAGTVEREKDGEGVVT